MIFEVTHHMALVPILWLIILTHYGRPRETEWWALALVFGISWLADTTAHWVNPWLVSAVYPSLQALVLALILLPFRAAGRFSVIVMGSAGLAVLAHGAPDIFARTVAWVGIVMLVWPQRSRLRLTVLTAFGLGWLGWVLYSLAPGWTSWGVYQGIRGVSLGVFCWASLHPYPALRAVRA